MHADGSLCVAVLVVGVQAAPPVADLTLDEPQLGLEATLDQAAAEETNGAFVAFIARYPDQPLADRARAMLAARRQPDAAPYPGPDGAIVAASTGRGSRPRCARRVRPHLPQPSAGGRGRQSVLGR